MEQNKGFESGFGLEVRNSLHGMKSDGQWGLSWCAGCIPGPIWSVGVDMTGWKSWMWYERGFRLQEQKGHVLVEPIGWVQCTQGCPD